VYPLNFKIDSPLRKSPPLSLFLSLDEGTRAFLTISFLTKNARAMISQTSFAISLRSRLPPSLLLLVAPGGIVRVILGKNTRAIPLESIDRG